MMMMRPLKEDLELVFEWGEKEGVKGFVVRLNKKSRKQIKSVQTKSITNNIMVWMLDYEEK